LNCGCGLFGRKTKGRHFASDEKGTGQGFAISITIGLPPNEAFVWNSAFRSSIARPPRRCRRLEQAATTAAGWGVISLPGTPLPAFRLPSLPGWSRTFTYFRLNLRRLVFPPHRAGCIVVRGPLSGGSGSSDLQLGRKNRHGRSGLRDQVAALLKRYPAGYPMRFSRPQFALSN
jgi:hypothetical protein